MTVIGQRYELTTMLGRGGMGEVWLGTNLGVGNQVAVKLLRAPEGEAGDYQARFLAEARIGVSLRHPGIAQVLDAGQEPDGRLYIVFELVEGEDLRKLLMRAGRLPWKTARDIVARVGEALSYAHERGVVHRDVKPENVRVQIDLVGVHVKVLDFGIARFSGDARLTAKGAFAGTPAYMAPEQTEEVEIDGRADQYCLGLILFELVTGQRAVAEKSTTQALVAQLTRALPRLREASVDRDFAPLDELLQHACSKDRSQRFASMPEFLSALLALPDPQWVDAPLATAPLEPIRVEDTTETKPSQIRSPSERATPMPVEPVLSPTEVPLSPTVRSAPAPRPPSSKVALIATFGALVVTSAVAATVAWSTREPAEPVKPAVEAPSLVALPPKAVVVPVDAGTPDDAGVEVVAVVDAGHIEEVVRRPADVKRPPKVKPPQFVGPPIDPPREEPPVAANGVCPQLAQFSAEYQQLSKETLIAKYRSTPYVIPSAIERTLNMIESMSESFAPATRDCQVRANVVAQIVAAKAMPQLDAYGWAHAKPVAELEAIYRRAELTKERTADAREAILSRVRTETTSPEKRDAAWLLQMSLGELLACELTDGELVKVGAKRGVVCRYP